MKQAVLGIDVSKATFNAALETSSGWRHEVFENSKPGFHKLVRWIEEHGQVMACLEASGNYWVALAEYLHAHGHQVHVANPLAVHRYIESNLQRTKTDKEDARLIAAYLVNLRVQPDAQIRLWCPSTGDQRLLRSLSRRVEEITKRRTEALNRSKDPQVPPSVRRSYEREIKNLEKERKQLEKEMDQITDGDPSLNECRQLIESIPGIGAVTARTWLAELGTAEQFSRPAQLVAFLGLCPQEHQSGTSVRGPNTTTRVGHRRLKKALYLPALTALRKDAGFQAMRQRHLERDKPKMKTVVAAMRKLVHIIFGVLKTRTPYDAKRAFAMT
jgi:transposase